MDEQEQVRIQSSYREGYQQGYYQAIKDFQSLVLQGVSNVAIIDVLQKFATGDLAFWRIKNAEEEQTPLLF